MSNVNGIKRVISGFCIALLLFGVMSIAGCKKVEDVEEMSSTASSSEASSSEPEPEPERFYNPLTGKEMKDDKLLAYRPLAIMINNIKISLPQKGISEADVIYELPVEGGITRMMALFSDYKKLPLTGTVRSSRHDYLELMLPLDAIYVHFGGSKYAYNFIRKHNLDTIDGIQTSNYAFWRDPSRAWKGVEHTWFTSYEMISKAMKQQKTRTKQKEGKEQKPIFKFANDKIKAKVGTGKATDIKVPFSTYVTATFKYNPKTKTYSKGQFGEPHIDETTKKAIAVKNVFLLFAGVKTISNYGHQDIDLSSGTGYYITNGKYEKITWSKKDVNSPVVYKDSEDKTLIVNQGKSYICFVPKGNKKSVTLAPPKATT